MSDRTETVESVIDMIRMRGFDSIAKRLTLLHKSDVEEPDEKPIMLDSLQNFARFISEYNLPEPRIGVNMNGILQTVWEIPNYGTLAMNFLSSDIMFVIIFDQQDSIPARQMISRMSSPHKMTHHLREFVDKLTL